MRPSRRSRRITIRMAWMVFWISAVLSLVMVVKGTEEIRIFAVILMLASAAWLVGSYVWHRMMSRGRRRRSGRPV